MMTALAAVERNSKSAMGNDKKDLTGILDLQRLQAEDPSAVVENTEQDPFALNELQAIEQVDEFASIDQIGMMDHPAEESPSVEASIDPFMAPAVDATMTPDVFATDQPVTEDAPAIDNFVLDDAPAIDDPILTDAPIQDTPVHSAPHLNDPFAVSSDLSFSADPQTDEIEPMMESTADPFQPLSPAPAVPAPSLDQVKRYSEKTSGITGTHSKIFYPFHLRIHGHCGPFERDKLFLFISENPIGLSTAELDLQIQAGKVFFPRISEYSAVKLIQELRDSGLSFQLHPSDQDEAIVTREMPQTFHYQNPSFVESGSPDQEIPILNENSKPDAPYQELEEVSVTQFVRTDLIEVENSAIIQEVIERMTEALKQKARIKGGNALMYLKKEITPLRLPSQYQISLKANVIRLP
jgi:hypothetical protein